MENNTFTNKIRDVKVFSDPPIMFMVLDYMESDLKRVMSQDKFSIS